MGSGDTGSRKQPGGSSMSSPALGRTDRASNSESDHSILSKDCTQKRQVATNAQELLFCEEASYRSSPFLDTTGSMPSPIYTDFQIESPIFLKGSQFSLGSGGDGFLGPSHAIDLTAYYVRQQHMQNMPQSSPVAGQELSVDGDVLETMQMQDRSKFADGAIRLSMLNHDMSDQMDNMIFGSNYESQMDMA
ncbi:hypothetical protein VE00_07153 [Pseudogymnoascus sp. WSF 3629]|nr:hypothetical protein VE00_07153 [Pseudogymnoascus sp. WSF 3629]